MDNGRGNLINEIKVHWAVEECANIPKLHEIFEDQSSIFLVLEET